MEFQPKTGPDIMRDPKAAKVIEEALANVLGEGDRCACVHATAWVRWCVNKCVCVRVCVCRMGMPLHHGWRCQVHARQCWQRINFSLVTILVVLPLHLF